MTVDNLRDTPITVIHDVNLSPKPFLPAHVPYRRKKKS